MNLYLEMITEWSDQETKAKIDRALRPPASWRDPDTGLPAGWGSSDDEDWDEWESSVI